MIENGQGIYIIDKYTDSVEYGIASEDDMYNPEIIKRIDVKYYVDRKGGKICNSYGTTHRKIVDIFDSYEEAYNKIDENYKKQLKRYDGMIKTIKDLLEFPLNNELCGEYADVAAIEVYKKKAKELLSVEL